MRVTNNPSPNTESAQSTKKTEKSEKTEKVHKVKSPVTDSVSDNGDVKTELSSRAKDMAQAKAVADKTPDVREEKIAALKKAISAGKYKVDADEIADKMVDEHMRMGGM